MLMPTTCNMDAVLASVHARVFRVPLFDLALEFDRVSRRNRWHRPHLWHQSVE
jgi:hypothetical protein